MRANGPSVRLLALMAAIVMSHIVIRRYIIKLVKRDMKKRLA